MQQTELPLAAYVHLPWCVQKCPYCDFNSHALRGELPEQRYLESLIDDISAESQRAPVRSIASVFIGGGTPSLFSGEAIARILDALERAFGFAEEPEITLEANPGTAEAHRFTAYRNAGVNRLSIGVQSFDDTLLRRLGRIHSSGEARRALQMARDAGFDNVNLDLMFGLPGQTVAGALAELDQA
ncbi:MAG: radical SAM family heme chaperone HemW, partial [Pseudomonadota bacterium]